LPWIAPPADTLGTGMFWALIWSTTMGSLARCVAPTVPVTTTCSRAMAVARSVKSAVAVWTCTASPAGYCCMDSRHLPSDASGESRPGTRTYT
jgi:hypothetical protein